MLEKLHTVLEHLERHHETQLRVERNQHVILLGLKHLLERTNKMSEIHDKIKTALESNASLLSTTASQVQQLIAMKDADKASFDDILEEVTSQSKNIAILSDSVGKAISSETPPTADSTQAPVTVTVTNPVDSDTRVVPVSDTSAVQPGNTVSGQFIQDGTTVQSVNHADSTVTLSDPTTGEHTGDGSETLTVTPSA